MLRNLKVTLSLVNFTDKLGQISLGKIINYSFIIIVYLNKNAKNISQHPMSLTFDFKINMGHLLPSYQHPLCQIWQGQKILSRHHMVYRPTGRPTYRPTYRPTDSCKTIYPFFKGGIKI